MRDDYAKFIARGALVLAIGPDSAAEFRRYWKKENLPYAGLPDPAHRVARLYHQEVNLFKLGRMPLLCVVDMQRRIRYVHYAASMSDIPSTQILLRVLENIRSAS